MMSRPEIPRHPEQVTAAWLSAVLGEDVTAVEITPIGTGQTAATYRAAVSYRGATGLPASLVVKLPSQQAAVRERVALGYRAEHSFYADVAATLTVPLPTCYYSDIADDGGDFVLLLADLAPAVQGDQLRGCGYPEAALAVEALAGLHGPRWCDPAWESFTGATMPKPDQDVARGMGEIARIATDTTLTALGARIPGGDRTLLEQVAALVEPWLLLAPDRFALLHGDYRIDNLLFDPDLTRVTVVDWQTLTVGLPARDLAYFLATSLAPPLRRDHERELVERYRQALLAEGVGADYTVEMCWQDYRIGMLQVPLITTLGYAFAAATERGDDMVAAMLRRGCTAIRELDTVDLITDLSR